MGKPLSQLNVTPFFLLAHYVTVASQSRRRSIAAIAKCPRWVMSDHYPLILRKQTLANATRL